MAYHLANDYVLQNPTKFQQKICNLHGQQLKEAIKEKSPHHCSERFVGYMEDDHSTFLRLRSRFPSGHIIFSNRTEMMKSEDPNAIENTQENYCFVHSKEDDSRDTNSFPVIPPSPHRQGN